MCLLNRRPFLSPKKRHAPSAESQEEMNVSRTREKTPPVPRKKIRGIEFGGEHRWSAQEKMKRYLERSESLEVGVGEFEYFLLRPSELDVHIRYLALHARGEQQQRLFHTFSQ